MDITSEPNTSVSTSPGNRRSGSCRSVGPLTIAAIVGGFILAWPLGLLILAAVIWRHEIMAMPFIEKMRGSRVPQAQDLHRMMARKPDNSALAAYLEREQLRLREEQKKLDELVQAFEAFKEAERAAADRRDFEAFLKQHDGEPEQPGKPDHPTASTS